MKIVVSIVSHGHQELLVNSGLIRELLGLSVVLRENKLDVERLITSDIDYYQNSEQLGFGENHNLNFEAAQLDPKDWFVVCNPDIVATREQVNELIQAALDRDVQFAAPALWDDRNGTFDDNVRPFPKILPIVMSYLGLTRLSRYPAEELPSLKVVDWASGAFFAVRADVYAKVSGFDEKYFMYVEDVDICKRISSSGVLINYFNDIKIIHRSRRDNRKFLSLAFYRHVKSLIRYFLS